MIDVKEFILSAIREGIKEAPDVYLHNLENQLKVDHKIEESGNASKYLQKLLEEAETKE